MMFWSSIAHRKHCIGTMQIYYCIHNNTGLYLQNQNKILVPETKVQSIWQLISVKFTQTSTDHLSFELEGGAFIYLYTNNSVSEDSQHGVLW